MNQVIQVSDSGTDFQGWVLTDNDMQTLQTA